MVKLWFSGIDDDTAWQGENATFSDANWTISHSNIFYRSDRYERWLVFAVMVAFPRAWCNLSSVLLRPVFQFHTPCYAQDHVIMVFSLSYSWASPYLVISFCGFLWGIVVLLKYVSIRRLLCSHLKKVVLHSCFQLGSLGSISLPGRNAYVSVMSFFVPTDIQKLLIVRVQSSNRLGPARLPEESLGAQGVGQNGHERLDVSISFAVDETVSMKTPAPSKSCENNLLFIL